MAVENDDNAPNVGNGVNSGGENNLTPETASYFGTDPHWYWSSCTQEPRKCTTSKEYVDELRVWLNQYYSWSQSQWFQMTLPYYMMGYIAAKQKTPIGSPVSSNSSVPVSAASQNQGQNQQRQVGRNARVPHRQNRIGLYEFHSPIEYYLISEYRV